MRECDICLEPIDETTGLCTNPNCPNSIPNHVCVVEETSI